MKTLKKFIYSFLKPIVLDIIKNEIRIWGDPQKLKISPKSCMVNTLFNTISGYIVIGDYTFTGHNVSIITGSHKYNFFLEQRINEVSKLGGDIKIGTGVWIGSNALILGPCNIGDHAVIAAGCLVPPNSNIPAGHVVAGIPAKTIKVIPEIQSIKISDTKNDFNL